jgi:glycosyltransferase involved in cell wall biosynthesis
VSEAVPVAFYAPMKAPDHPAPSGDRTMARLLLKALGNAGFRPELASALRSWDRVGDAAFQDEMRRSGGAEADRLVARWTNARPGDRPRLWFTYHLYYKAPDWIGPRVADALRIPYVVAEASRAGKRARGAWAAAHAGAEAALDRADAIFVMTEADREALERHRRNGQRLLELPPFIDLKEWSDPPTATPGGAGVARLLTVAMMRHGDKLASYRMLAAALAGLPDGGWTLDVVGDGEARPEVETLFADLAPHVRFHGRVDDRGSLAGFYAAADLFVWPAVNEAYGMAFLEVQALGCPVLASAYGGVASVVRHGETGELTAPGDVLGLAKALARLVGDAPRRRALGQAARQFVRAERGLDRAAERLRAGLLPLLGRPPLP